MLRQRVRHFDAKIREIYGSGNGGKNDLARDPAEDAIGLVERKLLATLERCGARS
jgi:hypothetical protein